MLFKPHYLHRLNFAFQKWFEINLFFFFKSRHTDTAMVLHNFSIPIEFNKKKKKDCFSGVAFT